MLANSKGPDQTPRSSDSISIIKRMYVFVSEDHMLDRHSSQICYPLEIKLLLLLWVKAHFRIVIFSIIIHNICPDWQALAQLFVVRAAGVVAVY